MDRSCPKLAFTLVEVLVSAVIFAIILIFFGSLFSSAQLGLKRLTNSTRQRQDARVVLATMARELKECLTSPTLSYEDANPAARQIQLLINPPSMGALANADTIFWSAASSGPNDGSGLIGYAVRWDTSLPTNPQPRFCRMFVPTNKSQLILSTMQGSGSAYWPTGALFDLHAPGDKDNGFEGWLADNILALYVRALDPENAPIENAPRKITGVKTIDPTTYMAGVAFDPSTIGPAYNNSYDARVGYQYKHVNGSTTTLINRFGPALPPSIEIALVAASPDTLGSIESIPAPVVTTASAMWQDIDAFTSSLPSQVKKGAHTYSTIVYLSASP